MAGPWKLEKGKTYLITVSLNWYEKYAPDGLIEHKFTENGFSDVKCVEGDGGKTRIIEGTWNNPDTVIPEESHLADVMEVKHKR
jgi:hypothetical protein